MIHIPTWYAVLVLVINGIGLAVYLILLAANQYPRRQSDKTAANDVTSVILMAIGLALWIWFWATSP